MRGAVGRRSRTSWDIKYETKQTAGMQFNLQLLSDCSSCFCRTTSLQSYDLNEIYDPAHIIGFILFACQAVDLDGDG